MEIYQIIKEKIINNELIPNSEISEADLCKTLNVSRTPVRESILRLRDEGFIIIRPRRSTLVAPITEEMINEIYEIRLINEPYIASVYFKNIDLNVVKNLENNFLNYEKTNRNHEIREKLILLDNQLHDIIINSCTNAVLIRLMQSVNDHNKQIRVYTSRRNSDYEASIQQHLMILRAIECQDSNLIENAVRYHILSGKHDAFAYYTEK